MCETGQETELMEGALAEAEMSYAAGGVPVGAVMAVEGRVIGRGHNRRVQDGNPMSHGETQCVMNVGRRAEGYRNVTMYTTLAPCMMCAGTIVMLGIPRVVVGENVNYAGELDFLRDRGVDVTVMAHQPCIDLMAKFIAERPDLWNEDIAVVDDE